MSDIEQKAIALLNEVRTERGYDNVPVSINRQTYVGEALCRALEQHEATKQEYSDFQQEVSDVASSALAMYDRVGEGNCMTAQFLQDLILPPKPDPLVELMERCSGADAKEGETWEEAMARNLRAALDACGLQIVEVKNDE